MKTIEKMTDANKKKKKARRKKKERRIDWDKKTKVIKNDRRLGFKSREYCKIKVYC